MTAIWRIMRFQSKILFFEPADAMSSSAVRHNIETSDFPEKSSESPGEITAERVALFISLFSGRQDVYALRRYSKRHGSAYYTPACRNEHVAGVCPKPKQKCGNCKQRGFIAFSAETVRSHLLNTYGNGSGIVGVYPVLQDETCRFLAMDFDGAGWMCDVSAIRAVCYENNILCAVKRSRSGNGAHVWFFFAEPMPAALARLFGSLLITKAMCLRHEIKFASYDRMFPSQDTMPEGGFGNLIELPLQGGSRANGNSVFVNADFKPYPDQWSYLAKIEKFERTHVEILLQTLNTERELGSLGVDPEAGGDTPWEVPCKPPCLLKNDFPKTLRCVEANMFFLEKAGLSQRAMNRIKRLAAFPNPGFHEKQRMRISTFGVPRIICAAEETAKWIALPRGCRAAVESMAEKSGVLLKVDDKREDGRELEVIFKGELRMDQTFAMDALASEENGVVSATTAFGKTAAAAALIAHLRRYTIVFVHTQTLLMQWKKALKRFLAKDVDGAPVEAGQLGGGKNMLAGGGIDVATVQSLAAAGGNGSGVPREYGVVIVD